MEKVEAQGYMKWREKVNEAIDAIVEFLGKRLRDWVIAVGELIIFAAQSLRMFFRRPYRFDELANHMEFIGNKSVLIISLTGVFTGAALTYQVYLGFKLVNATSLVSPVVGLAILRELGPVLTGLIISARAGGAMAARLGTMRVSEQIDALEVMGVDPRQYLVSPRLIAALLTTPLLCAVFDFMAMVGSYGLGVHALDLDQAQFIEQARLWLEPSHLYEGLFKAFVFGGFFSAICTHRGYFTSGGAAGVGNATNRGVVLSMVMIIVSDFFLTSLINLYYILIGSPMGR